MHHFFFRAYFGLPLPSLLSIFYRHNSLHTQPLGGLLRYRGQVKGSTSAGH